MSVSSLVQYGLLNLHALYVVKTDIVAVDNDNLSSFQEVDNFIFSPFFTF